MPPIVYHHGGMTGVREAKVETSRRPRRGLGMLLFLCLSCLARPAAGLVIEEPFHATFDHVAAAFGPDLLNIEPPVESRPLVKARPRDGCTPLQTLMDDGAIALVERGTCNFTQKVLHAQEAGASAVVVTDTRVTDKWLMVMYGDPENAQGIEIPAVLVSHSTGERLWSNRSWIPGRQGKLKASVGAAGHIVLQTRPVGALEMLGIYLLLSVLLLAFSGVCGLLFALAFTWYQRGYRTRAMRKLKSFKFRKRTQQTPAPAPSASPPALKTSRNDVDGNSPGGGRSSTAASTAEATTGAGHGRNLSSDTYGNDGGVKGSKSFPCPRRQRPRENLGSVNHGGGRAGGGDRDVDGAESAGKTALGGGGRGEDSSNSDLMGSDDDMCAICLETYEDGDSLTGLPCRHSFHTECIQPWLSGKSALCPMCKSEAFGKGGLFLATAPRLEAAFAELAALCTENLAVLGLFFVASVACGVIAAKLSLRE
eukprot:g12580.t1